MCIFACKAKVYLFKLLGYSTIKSSRKCDIFGSFNTEELDLSFFLQREKVNVKCRKQKTKKMT